MDEEIERLVVAVRADTQGFSRDVAAMRGELEGPLGEGIEKAGRLIETTLVRAIRTGKLGFEDLKRIALSVMAEIASAAIRAGIGQIVGSIGGAVGASLPGTSGLPGRATGGPVSPGRAYVVGERGPELFVPASSGRVAASAAGGGARDVRVTINVNASSGDDGARMLARSSRQVARAVRAAILTEN
jgi:phage-related minor tail protein